MLRQINRATPTATVPDSLSVDNSAEHRLETLLAERGWIASGYPNETSLPIWACLPMLLWPLAGYGIEVSDTILTACGVVAAVLNVTFFVWRRLTLPGILRRRQQSWIINVLTAAGDCAFLSAVPSLIVLHDFLRSEFQRSDSALRTRLLTFLSRCNPLLDFELSEAHREILRKWLGQWAVDSDLAISSLWILERLGDARGLDMAAGIARFADNERVALAARDALRDHTFRGTDV